jgi:hypothetical protein
VYSQGRRYRALNPWAEKDAALLMAVNRSEFVLTGFPIAIQGTSEERFFENNALVVFGRGNKWVLSFHIRSIVKIAVAVIFT